MEDFRRGGTGKELDTDQVHAGDLIRTAMDFMGVPHCMGGSSRKCMDCSGLLVAVFRKYHIQLPHNSEEQARYGQMIPQKTDLRKGDLVFFTGSYPTTRFITHAGIYLGDNQFIHASTKKGVTVTSLNDPWWKGKFVFGTRVLE